MSHQEIFFLVQSQEFEQISKFDESAQSVQSSAHLQRRNAQHSLSLIYPVSSYSFLSSTLPRSPLGGGRPQPLPCQ
jgi:hypothetical protein